MIATGCAAQGRDLGPFIDGELDGARMLRMSRHLDDCVECSTAFAEMTAVSQALRALSPADLPVTIFDGLAASVVTRSRAESAVSWRATLSRGLDDWHWAIAGGGAVAATFLSTSLLSAILAFGPAPQREDSLSALMTNLGSPAGFFFVYASPTGQSGQDVLMLQVENGRPTAPRLVSDLVASRANTSATEAELVERFHYAVTTSGGRIASLDSLGPERREVAEALLDEITRLRSRRSEPAGRSFQVHEIRLVTSTGVSAKQS